MALRVWFGGALVLVAGQASALSLGQLQGQATLGQPVSLRIPVSIGSSDSLNELCPTVNMYFGEELVSSRVVRIGVVKDPSGNSAQISLSTSTSLNEPYARIDVVVGCGNQVSRSYTLLSELPIAPSAQPVKPSTPVVQVPVVAGTGGSSAPQVSKQVPASPVSDVAAVDAPADTVRHRALAYVRQAKQEPATSVLQTASTNSMLKKRVVTNLQRPDSPDVPLAPRLKLDPVELMASVSTLSPSLKWAGLDGFQMPAEDAQTEQRRAAAREIWQVLNASPEQLAASRLQSEGASASRQQMQIQLAAAKQAESEARDQLLQAEDAVYTHPIVVGLASCLVLALGAVGFLAARSRNLGSGPGQPKSGRESAAPWWRRRLSKDESPASSDHKQSLRERLQKFLPDSQKENVDIDVDTLIPQGVSAASVAPAEVAVTGNQDTDEAKPTTQVPNDFLHSALMDGGRSVATEELFDLQQQVEFFISLGQSEQAVEVLVNHLSDSHDPSPLAYLDLLKLYHELGMRADYENLRVDFNRLFSGGAPVFDDYSYSRRGLERYETAMSRIQALWPRPEVLEVIERTIFRQNTLEHGEVFDLEAYRELLLLYGIAREIVAPDTSPTRAFSGAASAHLIDSDDRADSYAGVTGSPDTVLQPLAAQTREVRERSDALLMHSVPRDQDAQPFARTEVPDSGLDIDLSDAFVGEVSKSSERLNTLGSSPMDVDLSLDEMAFELPDLEPVEQRALGGVNESDAPDASNLFFDLGAHAHADPASMDFGDVGNLPKLTIKKGGGQEG